MHKTLIATLAAAAMLAGCVGDADLTEDLNVTDPLGLLPQTVAYSGCHELDAFFPIPMEAAREGLPAGFEPVPFMGSDTEASFMIWSTSCPKGEVNGGAQEAPAEMWGYLPVSVPEEYQDSSVGGYAIFEGAIVQDEAAAAQYHSWGLPTESLGHGGVVVARMTQAALRIGSADGFEEGFSVHMTATSGGLTGTFGGGSIRAFVVQNETVTAAYDSAWTTYTGYTQGGHGTVQFEGEGQTMLGLPTGTSAYVGFGYLIEGISYTNTLVTLPTAAEPTEAAEPAPSRFHSVTL